MTGTRQTRRSFLKLSAATTLGFVGLGCACDPLFIEPNDQCLVDNADNLVVSPWGDLLLAEDGLGEQYLVGVTPDGAIYKVGRNAFSQSEFAGLTFAPDGIALFVNIQHSGLMLAIFGPWQQKAASLAA